jgi:hypothetical protein
MECWSTGVMGFGWSKDFGKDPNSEFRSPNTPTFHYSITPIPATPSLHYFNSPLPALTAG